MILNNGCNARKVETSEMADYASPSGTVTVGLSRVQAPDSGRRLPAGRLSTVSQAQRTHDRTVRRVEPVSHWHRTVTPVAAGHRRRVLPTRSSEFGTVTESAGLSEPSSKRFALPPAVGQSPGPGLVQLKLPGLVVTEPPSHGPARSRAAPAALLKFLPAAVPLIIY
eukprot:740649-Hanusia_phi.AAC.1